MAEPSFRARLQELYFGESRRSRRFRYGLILFDVATICVFLLSSVAREQWWMMPLDLALALLLSLDFAGRLYAENDRRRQLLSFATAADVVVIVSLMLPAVVDNLAFLRIARSLRLLRSYHLLRDVRGDSEWFRCHEDVVQRMVKPRRVHLRRHLGGLRDAERHKPADLKLCGRDALYFTITTLTTTGFGDITLQGPGGRLFAVVKCPDCGLLVHDADAVHCKHCGRVLHIETEGGV
jgi:voltage-gated potassium channel